MRLNIVESKNAKQLYIIKSCRINGKNTSKIVEKLGTYENLLKEHDDPIAWGKERAAELTRLEKEQMRSVSIDFKQDTLISSGERKSFNCGYLFLEHIYHSLGLHKICKTITKKYKFEYNLDSILSRLIYSRIIFPSSKLSTFQMSKNFLEKPEFELNQIYRSLDVLASETDFIQSELYKNSKKLSKRNDRILYYDCTNYFFETEEADGIRQYGISKENRPNPLVQMGLFMDGDGIPLAFHINSGNTNEQTTLKPLEEQLIKDFGHSKFVVCTDAGLSSTSNRLFNNKADRAFITTQSIKKLKAYLKEWSLAPDGWRVLGSDTKVYNLKNVEESTVFEHFMDKIFYKERWINENGIEQKLIATFSFRYRDYHRSLRDRHIERATKALTKPSSLNKKRATDMKRLIKSTPVTKEGEIAEKNIYELDIEKINEESRFDGFYGICTNLEDNAEKIARISHNRWEIEECFRIMKSEFKARPVYLRNDERIKAHFTTCFLSLVVFRYLEKVLENKVTTSTLIATLKNMNMLKIKGEGYIPVYERNEWTDQLHEKFGFRTDYEIISTEQMKKILKKVKT